MKNIIFILAAALLIIGCSAENTGNVVSEPSIYEEASSDESAAAISETPFEDTSAASESVPAEPEIIEIPSMEEKNKFKFNSASLISTGKEASFSLDDMDSEIKGPDWGKIVHIVSTVYNKNASSFRPKILVRLHDEKDAKEEWYKPKAEFDYGVEELKAGEHAAADVFVNVAFNDLNLTKKFEMVLVDGKFDNHRALASLEMDFNALG